MASVSEKYDLRSVKWVEMSINEDMTLYLAPDFDEPGSYALVRLKISPELLNKPIVIPHTLPAGGKITGISREWTDLIDSNCIASFTLSDGITCIEDGCFSGLHITSLTLSKNITEIPVWCFESSVIDNIYGIDNVKVIGNAAFEKFRSKNFSFAALRNLEEIGQSAFKYADIAEFKSGSIKLNDNIGKIGANAFLGTKIAAICWPKKCKEIPKGCFKRCHSLKSITGISSVEKIDKDAFYYCRNLSDISWPEKCTVVPIRCFEKCERLLSIDISNAEIIESRAFCATGLKKMDLSGTNITSVGERAFKDSALEEIIWPDKASVIPTECFINSQIRSISNLSMVGRIEKYAFYSSNITQLDLSDTKITNLDKGSLLGIMSCEITPPYYLSEENFQEACST